MPLHSVEQKQQNHTTCTPSIKTSAEIRGQPPEEAGSCPCGHHAEVFQVSNIKVSTPKLGQNVHPSHG
jgi:hypothetical protein